MPRSARKKSNSGIYHVVFRGINKQKIFTEDEDYRYYLHKLIKYKEISGYEIYAYCLMSNHIHLLIKEGREDLGRVFRRLGASYVYWFNRKYDRVGHLFQDRFKSEPVEKDDYFMVAMRYIHQNPIKAGIVKDIKEYPWSSYREYLQKDLICNTSFVLKLFSDDPEEALKKWIKFNYQENDDKCLEYENGKRIKDSEAVEIIKDLAKVEHQSEVKAFQKEKRNVIIKNLKERGLSIRQIERLTGVSFAVTRSI